MHLQGGVPFLLSRLGTASIAVVVVVEVDKSKQQKAEVNFSFFLMLWTGTTMTTVAATCCSIMETTASRCRGAKSHLEN